MKFKYTYIKFNEDLEEYSIHIKGKPKATYYTDCKDDAKLTRAAMEEEEINLRREKSK